MAVLVEVLDEPIERDKDAPQKRVGHDYRGGWIPTELILAFTFRTLVTIDCARSRMPEPSRTRSP